MSVCVKSRLSPSVSINLHIFTPLESHNPERSAVGTQHTAPAFCTQDAAMSVNGKQHAARCADAACCSTYPRHTHSLCPKPPINPPPEVFLARDGGQKTTRRGWINGSSRLKLRACKVRHAELNAIRQGCSCSIYSNYQLCEYFF